MMYSNQNNLNGMSRFVNRLAAEKKKTIIALCLVTVMGLMWVRVLTGRKTTTAAQGDIGWKKTAMAVQSVTKPKLVFMELPDVEGRNDVLVRDFFSVNQWEAFIRNNNGEESFGKEVSMTVGNTSEQQFDRETILQVAKLLKLTVIELGERPHAFINDTLLSIGEILLVEYEDTSYEFTLVTIKGNEVLLTCQGVNIEMKLLHPEQSSN